MYMSFIFSQQFLTVIYIKLLRNSCRGMYLIYWTICLHSGENIIISHTELLTAPINTQKLITRYEQILHFHFFFCLTVVA